MTATAEAMNVCEWCGEPDCHHEAGFRDHADETYSVMVSEWGGTLAKLIVGLREAHAYASAVPKDYPSGCLVTVHNDNRSDGIDPGLDEFEHEILWLYV